MADPRPRQNAQTNLQEVGQLSLFEGWQKRSAFAAVVSFEHHHVVVVDTYIGHGDSSCNHGSLHR